MDISNHDGRVKNEQELFRNKEISLAILPFENLTDNDQHDLYCRSFQIDLITELSRFRQFRIIAPPSNGDFSDASADYSIKGSFQHFNDRMKITAQLINNQNNHIAWADRFEGSRESIFSIQEGLLTKVVSTLQQQLNYDLLNHIRRKTKINLSAYEHWLYGMEELKKGSVAADERARTYFQQAIDIDPQYSLAYSGMSMTYFNEWSCQLWDRWEVSQAGAYDWARKAIELDEHNYVAACVLGRVYLYEAQYEISEHYLRRALRLNPNDTDNLVQIASCYVYLGYVKEADELYQRVLHLNPMHSSSYDHIAALIAFELGDYRKCILFGESASTPWVDFPALMAAAYYEVEDLQNMRMSWQAYLNTFQKKILHGGKVDDAEALQWLINVSPYRERTNLLPFWEFIGGKKITPADRIFFKAASPEEENYIMKENDRWEICFEGKVIHLTEVKGFFDLAKLVANPERQFHCTELAGGAIVTHGEPVFDEKAKREYHKKIIELQEEIRLSENNNDLHRTTNLQKEYDEIVDHLSISLGIGKRTRRTGDPFDKVRSAVTWRIRNAIRKISKEHNALGKHLSVSIRTGLFCSYNPDRSLKWVSFTDI